jgi:hypothetical protein
MRHGHWVLITTLSGLLLITPARADDELRQALAVIKALKKEGRGNEDAGPAWKTVVSKGSAALLPTLEAFDDTNPIASNWLRPAIDVIVNAERSVGRKLPADQLEAFATNTKFAPSARRLAYELLIAQDPDAKARLLPGFLNDKSPDLRRDAIANELAILDKSAKPSIRADLEKLFAASRDQDQVELIAQKLKAHGVTVSVPEHFGFITQFALIGPFDGPEGKGLTTVHPPEMAKAATGQFKGKDNAEIKWITATTTDRYGTFDLNKLLGKHKNAVAYALAVVVAEKETPCEIRATSITSVKIFLNQKEIFARDEYHHGDPLDAHIGKGLLKKGENVIVLKVCQNDQKEPWAQDWKFKLRVCDDTGGPISGLTQLPPNGGPPIKLGYIPPGSETHEEEKK